MRRFGPIQRKIMIILLGGVTLGVTNSPRQYQKVFRSIKREWKKSDRYSLNRSIESLSKEKLIEERKDSHGNIKLILTQKGRDQAKRLGLVGGLTRAKKVRKWDGKWRIVMFDIPEKDRAFRDVLRIHLKELGFLKLQNSVFVSPYPFEKIITELAQLYQAEKYVRIVTALKIDNEKILKEKFFKKK
jgi:CRISPR-associated endonuclease Cas2